MWKKLGQAVVWGGLLSLSVLFFSCGEKIHYTVKILNLAEGELLDKDSVAVQFIVSPEDWQERGFSVHFLLDGDHLQIKRDLSPVIYTGLSEGAHAVFALVCDGDGFSLKSPEAVDIRNFFYRVRTEPLIKKSLPLLILHQPESGRTYRGKEAFRIPIDFRVLNAPLGEGYRVHMNLDGEDFYFDKEKGFFTDKASRIGEHDLTFTLETEMGNPVLDNPFNRINIRFWSKEK